MQRNRDWWSATLWTGAKRTSATWAGVASAICWMAAALYSPRAEATDRPFTYTYGSDVLFAGLFELEPWTTVRAGRDNFFVQLDHRLEFEFGLSRRLQTAWYLNFSAVNQDVVNQDGSIQRASEFHWTGISWEWKYKLFDSLADPIGVGLYFEPAYGPTEASLEFKLIFDKRIGDFYAAFNAVAEQEWNFEHPGSAQRELGIEFDLGLTYFIVPQLAAGIEVRNHNEFPAGSGWEHSALFLGPVISYLPGKWWATLSVLPQLPALKKNESGSTFILDAHERINARLIFGVHL